MADVVGKGIAAAGLAAVSVSALRASRRNGEGLEEAVLAMHRAVQEAAGSPEAFVTAVVGRLAPGADAFCWVNCGHPRPIVVRADGACEELWEAVTHPLGLFAADRELAVAERPLGPGDRLVLYSDGLSERRTGRGFLGQDAVLATLRSGGSLSAAATVVSLAQLVRTASADPLADDATVMVIRRTS